MNILITYASTHGTTASVAQRINSHFHTLDPSLKTSCLALQDVTNLTPYTAIIIGSVVHAGRWDPPALHFLDENKVALSAVPVWAFSVGAPTSVPKWMGGGQKMRDAETENIAKDVGGRVRIKGHVLFDGRLRGEDVGGGIWAKLWSCCGIRYGDWRNWEKVEEWTGQVFGELSGEEGGPSAS